jgi:hypothetical protein
MSLQVASRPVTAVHQFPRLSIWICLATKDFSIETLAFAHTVWHARQERWKPGRQRVDADRSASPEFQVTYSADAVKPPSNTFYSR